MNNDDKTKFNFKIIVITLIHFTIIVFPVKLKINVEIEQ